MEEMDLSLYAHTFIPLIAALVLELCLETLQPHPQKVSALRTKNSSSISAEGGRRGENKNRCASMIPGGITRIT